MATLLNLPQKDFQLKIGPYTYSVEFKDHLFDEASIYSSQVSEVTQTINISCDQTEESLETSFLYAVMLICSTISGVGVRIEEETKLTEEDLVTSLSTAFSQTVQANPKIFNRFRFPEYPFKLQVGNFEYAVKEAKSIDYGGRLCLGITESAKQEIGILHCQPQTGKDTTFIHELFHVIMDLSGLRFRLQQPNIQDIVHCFTIWLLTIIHQNPKVFREKA
jgi:hypothetical protein